MGKKNKSSATTGGGRKFSVFEFNCDDYAAEAESRKRNAKYREIVGRKKPNPDDQPVDKYCFLGFFAKGGMAGQNDSIKDVMDVDVPDHVSVDKNNILSLDSEEDPIIDSISIGRLDDEGTLKAETSNQDPTKNDCEPVVVVSGKYAKYGNIRYSRCFLFFSSVCIRLEGSIPPDIKNRHVLEWAISDILNIEHQHDESAEDGFICMLLKLDGKNGDDAKNHNSGFLELEFLNDDPRWYKKQEEIKSLDFRYKAAWRTIGTEWRFNEPCRGIVFPDGDPDSIFISSKDIQLLQPGNFINDTIIDFYIKYLVSKINPEEQHRFHFFNTFFFPKLVDVVRNCSVPGEGKYSFQSIQKWTKNVNIFEKDHVFIPINLSLHWSLIVICYPGRISTYEVIDLDDSDTPCILHMNSISGSHKGFENDIKRYLWEEWKRQHSDYNEDISSKFDNLEFKALQLPQQENCFDCGLFLLHYVELFLNQVSNSDGTNYNDILDENWFHPAEVTFKKRHQIRKLIQKIVDDGSSGGHSPCQTNNEDFRSGRSRGFLVRSVDEKGSDDSCIAIKNISDDEHHEIKGQQSSPRRQDKTMHKSLIRLKNVNEEAIENPSTTRSHMKDEHTRRVDISSMDGMHGYESDVEVSAVTPAHKTVDISEAHPVTISLPNEARCVPEIEPETRNILIEQDVPASFIVEDSEEQDVLLSSCIVVDSEEQESSRENYEEKKLAEEPVVIDIS